MTPRPAWLIQHELDAALAYQRQYQFRTTEDPWILGMRADCERRISALQVELTDALSGDVEIRLDGTHVTDHAVTLPFLNRVLESFQSAYRAAVASLAPDKKVRRAQSTLTLASTSPGSFIVHIKAPLAQMEITQEPLADRGMRDILDLLDAATDDRIATLVPQWVSRADDRAVRAMVRFSTALASSHSTTHLHWRPSSGFPRSVAVTAEAARSLAIALVGDEGQELVTVIGHLQMAQDQPPKVRVTTEDDEFVAAVSSDALLSRVKDLLFGDVQATLLVDMRTSRVTGAPSTTTELLDISEA